MEKITQQDFEAYVEVQESGVTNMFDVSVVIEMSGLERNQILTIMKNYSKLKTKYHGEE
tara:strand:+ start:88 stop:264 length:177 start_codon:yes stop_codon:yes gene_type:complete